MDGLHHLQLWESGSGYEATHAPLRRCQMGGCGHDFGWALSGPWTQSTPLTPGTQSTGSNYNFPPRAQIQFQITPLVLSRQSLLHYAPNGCNFMKIDTSRISCPPPHPSQGPVQANAASSLPDSSCIQLYSWSCFSALSDD